MTEVWGNLNKSQSDSEYIETAISRLISAHESDPDAHLGEGDSLQSHKASEIIDHIAGSVVADKIGNAEFVASSVFSVADGWIQIGGTFTRAFPSLTIEDGSTLHQCWKLYSEGAFQFSELSMENDVMFQTVLRLTDADHVNFTFGLCYKSAYNVFDGVGFDSTDGSLSARLKAGSNNFTIAISGVDMSLVHCYRIQIDSALQKIYFFVDGEIKATITPTDVSFGIDMYIGFYNYNTLALTYSFITLYSVTFSSSYIG